MLYRSLRFQAKDCIDVGVTGPMMSGHRSSDNRNVKEQATPM